MNIIPFQVMRDLDTMRREFDRVYRFSFPFAGENYSSQSGHLLTDVYETDDQLIVSCDVPGLQRKEDVNISLENTELVISGTINREQHVLQEERMHRKERYTGNFHHKVSLPQNVSNENIKAIYKTGVLNVFLPKASTTQKKSVDIKFEH